MKKYLHINTAILLICALMLQSCTLLREADGVGRGDITAHSDSVVGETEIFTDTESSVTDTSEKEDDAKKVSISFTAAGDDLIHPNIYYEAASRTQNGRAYNFKPMFSDVTDIISRSDFAFINQETVMAGENFEVSGYPSFNSPQELGLDLVELGFDIINIANNHMLDKSAAGLSSTLDFWHTQPITLIGAFYDSDDAKTIRTITSDGITIALLSYTYGTNGIVLPEGSELDIPYIEDSRICKELAEAEEIADFTIVSVHWGTENSSEPDDEQRRLARLIADNGADVILGHHSHTLQSIEWIECADGRTTLCAYSLGNLVSAMMYPENMVAGFLNFTVSGSVPGELTVTDISFVPTVFYYGTDFYGTHIYLLEDYTSELAATHGTQMYGRTTTPEEAEIFVRRAIPEDYLPDFMKSGT